MCEALDDVKEGTSAQRIRDRTLQLERTARACAVFACIELSRVRISSQPWNRVLLIVNRTTHTRPWVLSRKVFGCGTVPLTILRVSRSSLRRSTSVASRIRSICLTSKTHCRRSVPVVSLLSCPSQLRATRRSRKPACLMGYSGALLRYAHCRNSRDVVLH